jgi:hypothetical protein
MSNDASEIDTEFGQETEQSEYETETEESTSSKKQLLEKNKVRAISSSETSEDENVDENLYQDAIKKYYKLKNDYDESINNQKKEILAKSGLSIKEKRSEFRKLKNKCVNCKRPVGSIFSTKVIGQSKFSLKDRVLIALCGDRDEPCPLNIEINLGATKDLRILLIDLEKDLLDYKNKVIKDKNDLLFGYITSEYAVRNFDEIKADMKSTNELYDLYFQKLNEIVDNEKKKEDYQTLLKGFYENIESLKSMIQEFEQSADTQYVLDAVELYSNEILPQSNKIMKEKYAYNAVDYDEDDKTYHLDQREHTLQQFELDSGESDHAIISMKFGMPKNFKKTDAISKEIEEVRIPALKKTRRKPKLVIKESLSTDENEGTEQEQEQEEEEQQEEQQEDSNITLRE